jgi:xylan 1,4-beta-xylosidase
VLSFGLGVSAALRAQPQPGVTIDVDATAPEASLESVWAYYGYDEANYTSTPEGEELLRTLASANSAPVHVRTHFLFNTGDGAPALKWGSTNIYTEDAAGNPIYDYTLIDQIMDATVGAGTLPFVEMGFMPEALSTQPTPYQNTGTYVLNGGCFHPPKDYEKWGDLVAAWAAHVKQRYPGAESDWQWELWNEPDIGYWQGTFEEYARLYDYTEAGLHGVLPAASLGGPATTSRDDGFLAQFLEHCATGTNAVTGETGTRLDIVTFHAKGGVTLTDEHVQMDLGNQLRLHRTGFQTVAESGFADTPIVISEADPDGCAACLVSVWAEYAYRNSPAYGAYELTMMKRSLELASQVGVELRGVLTWAFTFPGSPYFAGYRALSTNGIHLPVLNAFKLLGRLTGDQLPLTSNGALPLSDILESGVRSQPDVDALATLDGHRIQILVWNYHDELVDAEPSAVTLKVRLPAGFGDVASVIHTRVDETHGDAFTVWEAQGSPPDPSDAELAELRESMEPVTLEERTASVRDQVASLSFNLPRFGISLLTLEPALGGDVAVADNDDDQETGCSCRVAAPKQTPHAPLVALLLVTTLALKRRSARCVRTPPARADECRSSPPLRDRVDDGWENRADAYSCF